MSTAPVSDGKPKKATKKATPRARRARGTGTIFFNEKIGRWVGRKVVGGKLVERKGMTQKEVVAALEHAAPPDATITVAAWSRRWLEGLHLRPASLDAYGECVNLHINPAIGHLRLTDVRPSHIEGMLSELVRPAPQGKGLSVGTSRKVTVAARAMFSAAVREEIIPRNPVAVAKKPKGDAAEINPFTPAELRRIIDAAAELAAGPLLALLAATGCRLGEASGLNVEDYDADAGTVDIVRTYSAKFGEGPPKSKHSKRTIRLPVIVRPIIDAAAAGRDAGPLFLTSGGKRFDKANLGRAFKRLLAALELESRNIHQLRHSVATAMISNGTPLPDAAKYLGDSVATVVKTYLHPSGADPAADLERLFDL